jgi:hypothetical protein
VSLAEKFEQHKYSIPLAIKTRWSSQYHTICKVLEIPPTLLNDILRDAGRPDLVLTTRDISVLQEFVTVFALFAEATTRTQVENSTSISLVAPIIMSIYFDLQNEQTNCKYVGAMCRALITSLKERFGGLLERFELFDHIISPKKRTTYELYKDDFYLIAPFLDGQFKMRWIDRSNLSEAVKQRTTTLIKNIVYKAALQLYGATNNNPDVIVEPSPTDIDASVDSAKIFSPILKRKRLFSEYDTPNTHAKKKRSAIGEMIEDEISSFEKELHDDSHLIFKKKEC